MALIIQKFGGTSVANFERIKHVAQKVIQSKRAGHQVVVVSSAMGGDTNQLIQMATSLYAHPCDREYDALLATGEQIAVALIAIALVAKGCKARSYTGIQAGIKTNAVHKKARITSIDARVLQLALDEGVVPVVAGFQGLAPCGSITTLGRGGSDTTAVALAVALKASECQIYTDVKGVCTADPRIVPLARRLVHVTFEEMLEMASLGAKVLQIRSVAFAAKYHMPIRVLSSLEAGDGTLITCENKQMEQALVSSVTFDSNQAKLTLVGLPDSPQIASQIMSVVSYHNIDVDMIVQNVPSANKTLDFSFTVKREDYSQTHALMTQLVADLGAQKVLGDPKVVKLSLVGVGMRSHTGVGATMFNALASENIGIQMISTSEIKISVIVDEKYLELGTRSLHTAFDLDDQQPQQD